MKAVKSGITAASKGAQFLGYHVCAFTLRSAGSMARRVRGGRSLRVRRRPTRGNIKLWVPRERVYPHSSLSPRGPSCVLSARALNSAYGNSRAFERAEPGFILRLLVFGLLKH